MAHAAAHSSLPRWLRAGSGEVPHRERSIACRSYGKGSGMDRVQELIARESNGGKFGPPPPTDRTRGQGFINLSFRDTALQDGIEEARSVSEDMDEAGADPAQAQGALKSSDLAELKEYSKSPSDLWGASGDAGRDEAASQKRFMLVAAGLFAAGLFRRLPAFLDRQTGRASEPGSSS